jgi:hypothetical protein
LDIGYRVVEVGRGGVEVGRGHSPRTAPFVSVFTAFGPVCECEQAVIEASKTSNRGQPQKRHSTSDLHQLPNGIRGPMYSKPASSIPQNQRPMYSKRAPRTKAKQWSQCT